MVSRVVEQPVISFETKFDGQHVTDKFGTLVAYRLRYEQDSSDTLRRMLRHLEQQQNTIEDILWARGESHK